MKWSASALQSKCAYQNVLRKLVPMSENMRLACDRGSEFHRAVEERCRGGRSTVSPEVGGWVDSLFANWEPPAGAEYEVAMGLGPTGRYVPVVEPSPHVYASVDGSPLLTAGRADLVWIAGDTINVADYKTGRMAPKEPNHSLQLLALGFAAADWAQLPKMQLSLYLARDAKWLIGAPIDLESDEAAVAWQWVHDAAMMDETPHYGRWCRMCFVRSHCATYIGETV